MRSWGEIEPKLRPAGTPSHLGWHSPVPYLFGGLAAMLGLVGFALLILACSYWRVSSSLNEGRSNNGGRHGAEGKVAAPAVKKPASVEAKVVVIMAGDDDPTYLATPVCASPFPLVDGKESVKAKNGDEEGEDRSDHSLH